jgi:hypothetical protein
MNRIRPLEREIFEDVSIHRLVLGENFHRLFMKQPREGHCASGMEGNLAASGELSNSFYNDRRYQL